MSCIEYLSPGMIGRVVKEMSKYKIPGELIDKRYLYVPIELYPSLEKIAEQANKDPSLILDLKFYPFKVPRISYLSMSVDSIYKTNTIFNEIIKNITGDCCLCCSSFICNEKWVPSNTINQIIDEFKDITTVKARAVEIYCCDRMQEHRLPNGLPVQDYPISQYL
tara:strand:+ start:15622 stop:16116 length:495 start_codon:yes stop_codon:yes gene_type:complete